MEKAAKTIEEQFNTDLRWIIRELKLEEMANQYSQRQVEFYVNQNSNYEPSEKSQHRILKMLSDRKTIQLSPIHHRLAMFDTALGLQGSQPIGYHIRFIQPNFDKVVEEVMQEKVASVVRSLPPEEPVSQETKDKPDEIYFISMQGKKVVLNNTLLIASPNFDGENDNFMDFILPRAGEKLNKKKFSEGGLVLKKNFHQLLNGLGFRGEIRKMFFNVSKTTILFINNVKSSELEKRGVDITKLQAEISRLKAFSQEK